MKVSVASDDNIGVCHFPKFIVFAANVIGTDTGVVGPEGIGINIFVDVAVTVFILATAQLLQISGLQDGLHATWIPASVKTTGLRNTGLSPFGTEALA